MVSVVLSLGSNLGDQYFYICQMEKALRTILKGTLARSDLMKTEPVGVKDQLWFLNRIISGSFDGTARQLLESTRHIEESLGREKKGQMASRTADIDILLFGEQIINDADLIVPHPRMLWRRFCIEGMNQIVPQWRVPGTEMSVSQHFKQMSPQLRAQRIFISHEKGSDCSDGRP